MQQLFDPEHKYRSGEAMQGRFGLANDKNLP